MNETLYIVCHHQVVVRKAWKVSVPHQIWVEFRTGYGFFKRFHIAERAESIATELIGFAWKGQSLA
ncbi:hypothetical protein D6779_09280 [Candidatus Parcubacteria bacterium]|nr:MAG: hypothetical protein D6779_09280 [Candidatus Parcubacteria bacterium]